MIVNVNSLELERLSDIMESLNTSARNASILATLTVNNKILTIYGKNKGNEWKASINVETEGEEEFWNFDINIKELHAELTYYCEMLELSIEHNSILGTVLVIQGRGKRGIIAIVESNRQSEKFQNWECIINENEDAHLTIRDLYRLSRHSGKSNDDPSYQGIWMDFSDEFVCFTASNKKLVKIKKTNIPSERIDNWEEKHKIKGITKKYKTVALRFGSGTTRLFNAISYLLISEFYLGQNAEGVPGFRFRMKLSYIDIELWGTFAEETDPIIWRIHEENIYYSLKDSFVNVRQFTNKLKQYGSNKITIFEITRIINEPRTIEDAIDYKEIFERRPYTKSSHRPKYPYYSQ